MQHSPEPTAREALRQAQAKDNPGLRPSERAEPDPEPTSPKAERDGDSK
jgi:hypothetical protein